MTAPVGMNYAARDTGIGFLCIPDGLTTKRGSHIVVNCKTQRHQIIAVKDARNIDFTVLGFQLADVSHSFFERFVGVEVTLQKIIRLASFTIGFGYPIRLPARLVDKAYLFHDLTNCTLTGNFYIRLS